MPTPCTQRFRVAGRSAACGSSTVGDGRVVGEDIGLGRPGLRVQHLVEVGQREPVPVDGDDLLSAAMPPSMPSVHRGRGTRRGAVDGVYWSA